MNITFISIFERFREIIIGHGLRYIDGFRCVYFINVYHIQHKVSIISLTPPINMKIWIISCALFFCDNILPLGDKKKVTNCNMYKGVFLENK